jgi:biotin carboxyl carrier protein
MKGLLLVEVEKMLKLTYNNNVDLKKLSYLNYILENEMNEVSFISPIDDPTFTSEYGEDRSTGQHKGVDIRASSGTPVKSPESGVIIDAEMRNNACGGTIHIDHQNGYKTRYCHIKQIDVKKGDTVSKGQVIGLSGGDSNDPGKGRSTGPHLHFELYKNGQITNPKNYITSGGSVINAGDSTKTLEGLISNLKSGYASSIIGVGALTKLQSLIDKFEKYGSIGSKELDNIERLLSKLYGNEETTDIMKSNFSLDNNTSTSSAPINFIDLNTKNGYDLYKDICNNYINSKESNILGITGDMMATAAKNAYNKFGGYVPPELALAQLTQEGGLSSNPNSRPIRTKNPFNVGNVDSGKNVNMNTVMSGIQSYYDLISSKYLTSGRGIDDLLSNFVNKTGNRYASDINYESKLKRIIPKIQQTSEKLYASNKDNSKDKMT